MPDPEPLEEFLDVAFVFGLAALAVLGFAILLHRLGVGLLAGV